MTKYSHLFTVSIKSLFLFSGLMISVLCLNAQMLRIVPENPSPDDSISIFFYADQGNKALANYDGDVYMHTAVITGSVDEPSSWRYIQGEWGEDDYRVKMRWVKPNVYRKDIHIRSFYRLGISEPFLQLAFVFRDLTGSLVATPEDADEIYYPSLSELRALDLSQASGRDGIFLRNYQSHEINENKLLINAEGGDLAISFFQNQIARITFFPNKEQSLPKSEFVLNESLKSTNPQVSEDEETLRCSWDGSNQLIIQKSPLRLSWYVGEKQIISDADGFFQDETDQTIGFRFNLQPEEKVFGLGSHALAFNRRNHRFYLYHKAEENYSLGDSPLNMSLPHIVSSLGYSLLIDEGRKSYWDMGKTEGDISEYGVRANNLLTCYLIFSNEASQLVQKMTTITGKQAMPPLWAFGYLHGVSGNISESKLEGILREFEQEKIPLEAMIIEDAWDGKLNERGNFNWDKKLFPNPSLMMSKFRAKGIKTVLGNSPFILSYSQNFGPLASNKLLATSPSGSPYIISDFKFGQASLLDIFKSEASNWLWQQFEPLLAQGVDGWYSREIEPVKHPYNIFHQGGSAGDVHNMYAWKWNQSLARQYQTGIPGRRLFHLASSGNIGVQRHRALIYSGKPMASWEGLKVQTGIMLSTGLSAIPYMHSRIQGDGELGNRWQQLSVFSPIMWGSFTEESDLSASIRDNISLRYQFLPYNYSLAWEQATKALPLARPVFFEASSDSSIWEIEDQYLWGKNLMVAPILEANQKSRKVYLPQGYWFNFWNNELLNSGWQNIVVQESKIPLFVRAGTIIPLISPINNTSEFKGERFIFRYYPHIAQSVSKSEWYSDDGEDPRAIENKNFRLVKFNAETSKSKLNILWNVEGNGYTGAADTVNCIWEVYHIKNQPKVVKWMNKKLKKVETLAEFNGTPGSFYWENDQQRILIRFDWLGKSARLFIKAAKWNE